MCLVRVCVVVLLHTLALLHIFAVVCGLCVLCVCVSAYGWCYCILVRDCTMLVWLYLFVCMLCDCYLHVAVRGESCNTGVAKEFVNVCVY